MGNPLHRHAIRNIIDQDPDWASRYVQVSGALPAVHILRTKKKEKKGILYCKAIFKKCQVSSNENMNWSSSRLAKMYPLHIFVSHINFTHHHLFGRENLIEQQLQHSFNQYRLTDNDNCSIQLLKNQLNALYEAYDSGQQLLQQLQSNTDNDLLISAQKQRLDKYRYSDNSFRPHTQIHNLLCY